MKFFFKIFITLQLLLQSYINANDDTLLNAISGDNDLYLITVTKSDNNVLSQAEMYAVFTILQKFLLGNNQNRTVVSRELENIVQKLKAPISEEDSTNQDYAQYDNNFMLPNEAFIRNIDNVNILLDNIEYIDADVNNYQDVLQPISKSAKLVIFNEYFFGKGSAFPKKYFEEIIRTYTGVFDKTIFMINYLKQELQNVSVEEIDRCFRITKTSVQHEKLFDIVDDYNDINQNNNLYNKIKAFFLNTAPEYRQLIEYTRNTRNFVTNILRSAQIENQSSKSYLEKLKEIKASIQNGYIKMLTLQNISLYCYNGDNIMQYCKYTYFDEVQNLCDANHSFLYLFGAGIDTILSDSNFAYSLHCNISTEICRDLAVAARKDDHIQKRFHIVTSNTISLTNHVQNIPPCSFVVHADPHSDKDNYGGLVYKKSDENNSPILTPIKTIFETQFKILTKDVFIKIFKIDKNNEA